MIHHTKIHLKDLSSGSTSKNGGATMHHHFSCKSLELLLKTKKRHTRLADDMSVAFNYINLKSTNPEHIDFINFIQTIADQYGLSYSHPRITEYVAGDHITIHADTIPNVVYACVVRLNEGEAKLVVYHDQIGTLMDETVGQLIMFDPKKLHEVKKIDPNSNRITLNFWLVSG